MSADEVKNAYWECHKLLSLTEQGHDFKIEMFLSEIPFTVTLTRNSGFSGGIGPTNRWEEKNYWV